jgi:hypothetical protein
MRKLIPEHSWMKNTVTKDEAEEFDPNLGACCDPGHFRLHLEGTTCDRWNKSAAGVFVDIFLRDHHEYPPQERAVTRMVEVKTRSAIDSMIRDYRKSKEVNNEAERGEIQARKNRQERRRKVSPTVLVRPTCTPILTNCPSFITVVAISHSCTHRLNTIAHFWRSSRPPACPAMRRRPSALRSSSKSMSQPGGRMPLLDG